MRKGKRGGSEGEVEERCAEEAVRGREDSVERERKESAGRDRSLERGEDSTEGQVMRKTRRESQVEVQSKQEGGC